MSGTQSIFVEAREWGDTSGNTYYSARVHVGGEHVFTTGFSYGYGNQVEHDVCVRLVALGILPPVMSGRALSFARDHGFHVHTVKYQAKKRDLWEEEKSA